MDYDPSWDRTHLPGEDREWQESDCYWFFDAETQVGGFHRIGQKPNKMNGQIMLFAFKLGGERYSMNDSFVTDYPVTAGDRWETGMRVRKHTAEALVDKRMRYRWEEDESDGDLEFYASFHEPTNWPGHTNELMSQMNPGGHLECSGRIRGHVRIGGASYEIDAQAHRDRSWGFRDQSLYDWRRYRMASGTVGPALSFASFALDKKDTGLAQGGMVIRYGVKEEVVNVRVLTTFDADGYTTLGAVAILTLKSGEVLRIQCKGLQGFMTPSTASGTFITDTLCEIDWQGERGFCDIEVSPSTTGGNFVPGPEHGSLMSLVTGLSKSESYDILTG